MRGEIPEQIVRIGVDEAGRGPLLGRVYAGAVVLDASLEVDSELIRDSKTFSTSGSLRTSCNTYTIYMCCFSNGFCIGARN